MRKNNTKMNKTSFSGKSFLIGMVVTFALLFAFSIASALTFVSDDIIHTPKLNTTTINASAVYVDSTKLTRSIASVCHNSSCDYECDGTADDVQIQEAINKNYEVIIKGGTYVMAKPLNITVSSSGSRILRGEGTDATYLSWSTSSTDGIYIKGVSGGGVWQGFELRDLHLTGNNSNGIAIRSWGGALPSYSNFENLAIENWNVGIFDNGTSSVGMRFQNLYFKSCEFGINFTGTKWTPYFNTVVTYGIGNTAWYLADIHAGTCVNCDLGDTLNTSLNCVDCDDWVMINPYIDNQGNIYLNGRDITIHNGRGLSRIYIGNEGNTENVRIIDSIDIVSAWSFLNISDNCEGVYIDFGTEYKDTPSLNATLTSIGGNGTIITGINDVTGRRYFNDTAGTDFKGSYYTFNNITQIGFNKNNQMTVGRTTIGYGAGLSDYAFFSHIDYRNNLAGYGVIQSSTGATNVNSVGGQPLQFLINNVMKAKVEADGDFAAAVVNATTIMYQAGNQVLDVGDKASMTVNQSGFWDTLGSPDNITGINVNANHQVTIGRTTLGYGTLNDFAWFSHYDMRGANEKYSVIQSSTGQTNINSYNNPIMFTLNNVIKAKVEADGDFKIETELNLSGVNSQKSNVVCVKVDGTLGTCSDVVNATGECTCG